MITRRPEGSVASASSEQSKAILEGDKRPIGSRQQQYMMEHIISTRVIMDEKQRGLDQDA